VCEAKGAVVEGYIEEIRRKYTELVEHVGRVMGPAYALPDGQQSSYGNQHPANEQLYNQQPVTDVPVRPVATRGRSTSRRSDMGKSVRW
jgi:hypothetical protein